MCWTTSTTISFQSSSLILSRFSTFTFSIISWNHKDKKYILEEPARYSNSNTEAATQLSSTLLTFTFLAINLKLTTVLFTISIRYLLQESTCSGNTTSQHKDSHNKLFSVNPYYSFKCSCLSSMDSFVGKDYRVSGQVSWQSNAISHVLLNRFITIS